MSENAGVRLWDSDIGAVTLDAESRTAVFEYTPAFAASGIQVAPLMMPLRREPYAFPTLDYETFKGLPGMLADSLPDKYGNTLIDAWLATRGSARSPTAIERLSYTGRRGMGALEYVPVTGPNPTTGEDIQVGELVELASAILSEREGFVTSLSDGVEEEGLLEILSVGMSAGGARAKAVIAWNPKTNEVRAGQVPADPGFEHWLLKFDGVKNNRDKGRLNDPEGFGAVELAYSAMAAEAGIAMSRCRLFDEGDRRHFMTRRFDRPTESAKLHMQSLGALRHFDFNQDGAYSYEQALQTIRQLGLSTEVVEEQFRRMAFNVIARNQDDHVKNIAFLMDRAGRWSLSPAFDLTFAYDPKNKWLNRHQMTVNGKRKGFAEADLLSCAESVSLSRRRAVRSLAQVRDAVGEWRTYADEAGVDPGEIARIAKHHRLDLPAGR